MQGWVYVMSLEGPIQTTSQPRLPLEILWIKGEGICVCPFTPKVKKSVFANEGYLAKLTIWKVDFPKGFQNGK